MKTRYYRVSRLVVLPDYQGIGVRKRLLNFIAEPNVSQTKVPFYILTSNTQIIRGRMKNWKIIGTDTLAKERKPRINNEIRGSLSRNRITVSLKMPHEHLESAFGEPLSNYFSADWSGINYDCFLPCGFSSVAIVN